MAVDTRHVNLFLPQLIPNRELYSNQANGITGFSSSNNNNGGQMNSGMKPLNLAVPTLADGAMMLPLHHHQPLICEPKTSINTERSGLTCNNNNNNNLQSAPRKRSRDDCESVDFSCQSQKINRNSNRLISPFVGQDLLPQLQQHQLEIDSIISHHAKKMRIEMEERQKQSARMMVQALGEGLANKIKEKDEQIERMGKLNLALQDRLKSLYVENQLWRDLAQTNEATANSLRTNLEQVLAHVSEGPRFPSRGFGGGLVGVEEDAQSCCGSSDDGKGEKGEDEEGREARRLAASGAQDSRVCRGCGERDSCVLLLPCRHLCLCTVCGSSLLQNCPVCNSNLNATVHVNMSSS